MERWLEVEHIPEPIIETRGRTREEAEEVKDDETPIARSINGKGVQAKYVRRMTMRCTAATE